MQKLSNFDTRSNHQLVGLLLTHLKVAFFRMLEFFRVVLRYYPKSRFLFADCLLSFHYFFKSPYRISKKFMKKQGAQDLYTYGETPLTTLDFITRECRLLSKDTVIELGCGTGRTSFWLSCLVGCETIGIDYLPKFIQIAERVKKMTFIHNVNFKKEDFLKSDFKGATVIYLYGTTLEDELICKLVKRFSTLRRGAKVITVSYPLNDYAERPFFRVEKRFQATFPWGKADVYLNVRQ